MSPNPIEFHLRNNRDRFLGPPWALPLRPYLSAEDHVVIFSEAMMELKGDFGDYSILENQ